MQVVSCRCPDSVHISTVSAFSFLSWLWNKNAVWDSHATSIFLSHSSHSTASLFYLFCSMHSFVSFDFRVCYATSVLFANIFQFCFVFLDYLCILLWFQMICWDTCKFHGYFLLKGMLTWSHNLLVATMSIKHLPTGAFDHTRIQIVTTHWKDTSVGPSYFCNSIWISKVQRSLIS